MSEAITALDLLEAQTRLEDAEEAARIAWNKIDAAKRAVTDAEREHDSARWASEEARDELAELTKRIKEAPNE